MLPEHDFIRLDVTHPIFQSFFGLKTLNIPHPMLPGIEPVFLGLFEDDRTRPAACWRSPTGTTTSATTGNGRRKGLYGDAPTNDAYRLGVNYLVYEMTH